MTTPHFQKLNAVRNFARKPVVEKTVFFAIIHLAALSTPVVAEGQKTDDELSDVPSQEIRIGDDPLQRYFLIGPRQNAAVPEAGYRLLVVLPGGAGNEDFLPFVKRISKYALPGSYIVAQLVAPKWTKTQKIVWPTEKNRVTRMKFATEDHINNVIDDVAERHKLDPRYCHTLSWSSSGPAAYAAGLSNPKITGSFIAMSVYKPNSLPPLEKAEGKTFYLYQSPDDKVCPYRMAEQARKDLEKNNAKVELKNYSGGHGWRGPVFQEIRAGIEWLEENHSQQAEP